MPKYVATTPIKHDGKRYAVGDAITLKGADAERLQAVGAVEPDRTDAKADAEAKADAQQPLA